MLWPLCTYSTLSVETSVRSLAKKNLKTKGDLKQKKMLVNVITELKFVAGQSFTRTS